MLLTVGVVNLAGLIPASPGQIGVFEFFVSLVLIAVAVPDTVAHAYALVVHVVIWLPVTLVGFFFLVRQGFGLGGYYPRPRTRTGRQIRFSRAVSPFSYSGVTTLRLSSQHSVTYGREEFSLYAA